MTVLVAVTLAAFHLPYDELRTAGVFDHLGLDLGAIDRRGADLHGAVLIDHQHGVDRQGTPGVTAHAVDLDRVTLGHLVLFASRLNYSVHFQKGREENQNGGSVSTSVSAFFHRNY